MLVDIYGGPNAGNTWDSWSWNQTREDIQFAHRLAETTKGRVFFTAGRDLDRFVVWDYVNRRKSIIS